MRNLPPPNYYHTLGVPEDASDEQIKSRYREMAKMLHPDRNHRPTAEKEFKDLQHAYAILSNNDLRLEHDATLALAKVSDEPADEVDNVLDMYSITKPKKKKKKKKKRQAEHPPPPPPQPPRHFQRPAEADFEQIPPGFEPRVDFLGGE